MSKENNQVNFEEVATEIRFDIESIHENTSLEAIHEMCTKWENSLRNILEMSGGDVPRLCDLLLSAKKSETVADMYKYISEATLLSKNLRDGKIL